MSIVVEDGTGLSNADALVAVLTVDAYAAKRPYSTEWTALSATADKEAIIVDVSRMMSGGTEVWWFGEPINSTQTMCFPRSGVSNVEGTADLASNAVPNVIKDIVCEMCIQLAKQRRKDQGMNKILTMEVPGLKVGNQATDQDLSLAIFPDAVIRMILPYGKPLIHRPTLGLLGTLWG